MLNKVKHGGIALSLAVGMLFFSQSANASNNCWALSASKHNLDPLLLMAYGTVESSLRGGIESRNSNGTYDLGIMQINTIHLPYFSKMGYSRNDLRYDNCKNIMAAGYLVKESIRRHGYNINGIGGYHSNTPSRRLNYGKKVLKEYQKLVAMHRGGNQTIIREMQQSQPQSNYILVNAKINQNNRKVNQVNNQNRVIQTINQNAILKRTQTGNRALRLVRYVNPNNQQNGVPVIKQAFIQVSPNSNVEPALVVKRFARNSTNNI